MKRCHVILLIVCALLSALIISAYWCMLASEHEHFGMSEPASGDSVATLFLASECPDCAAVKEWLAQHGAEGIDKKVLTSIDDAEFIEAAQACGLPADLSSPPLLRTGDRCFTDSRTIIAKLQEN